MKTKSYGASFKAKRDEKGAPTGEVQAIVSVYGNVDLMGDRVIETAFDADLDTWKASGDPLPMVWSHDWANPLSHIGTWDPSKAKNVKADEAWEGSPAGLLLDGKVDVGSGNPVADWAAKLMAERRVKEFSFAYDIRDEAKAEDGANELKELGIIEAGPTLKGANPETELVMAKAMEAAGLFAKAGRVLSEKNATDLKAASDLILTVLKAAAPVDPKAHAKHDETAPSCETCGAPVGEDSKYVAPEADPENDSTEPEVITTPKAADITTLRARLALVDADL